MSSASAIASTTQPLSDILPWGPPIIVSSHRSDSNIPSRGSTTTSTTTVVETRTLLVTDACFADGRFLLHALALQFLFSRYSTSSENNSPNISHGTVDSSTMEGAVLLISCAPVTEKQIMMGLRKGLQHNLGGSSAAGAASGWTGGKNGNSGMGRGSSFGQSGIGISTSRIHIVSIPLELADAALEQEDGENIENAATLEAYLKLLHKRIVHWLYHRELLSIQESREQEKTRQENGSSSLGPRLVIIDNATTLGTLFGSTLANAFLSSVRASSRNHAKRCSQSTSIAAANAPTNSPSVTIINLLAVRASSPDDGGLYQVNGDDENTMKGEKLRSEYARLLRPWLGFGSGMSSIGSDDDGAGTNIVQMEEQSSYLSLSPHSNPPILYRCGLYEIADGIVDVSPLESGYARDVLGRLSFVTPWSGKGWWGISGGTAGNANARKKENIYGNYSSICVNYRCDDSGVRVMRLRTR